MTVGRRANCCVSFLGKQRERESVQVCTSAQHTWYARKQFFLLHVTHCRPSHLTQIWCRPLSGLGDPLTKFRIQLIRCQYDFQLQRRMLCPRGSLPSWPEVMWSWGQRTWPVMLYLTFSVLSCKYCQNYRMLWLNVYLEQPGGLCFLEPHARGPSKGNQELFITLHKGITKGWNGVAFSFRLMFFFLSADVWWNPRARLINMQKHKITTAWLYLEGQIHSQIRAPTQFMSKLVRGTTFQICLDHNWGNLCILVAVYSEENASIVWFCSWRVWWLYYACGFRLSSPPLITKQQLRCWICKFVPCFYSLVWIVYICSSKKYC